MLIDTPGFDDDVRTDVEILEAIAKWMAKKGYMGGQLLDGLIFLHPITLNRVGGSERKRTRLLEKILGPNACKRVIIATTMWDDLRSEQIVQSRLEGRMSAGGVWHDLCSNGATLVRHDNDRDSAQRIIQMIIEKSDKLGRVEPLLQTELKKNAGRVGDSSAGRELKHQLETDIKLIRRQLEDHEQYRPPASYRKGKNSEHKSEWKEWHEQRREMRDRLELREQHLKKLGSLVVSAFCQHVSQISHFRRWC